MLSQIQTDLIAAMRAKDEITLNTLRSVKTALDRFTKDNPTKELNEAASQAVLNTLCKQRKEAAEAFRSGGRIEMAEKEEAELAVLQSYMPQEASETQITDAIAAAVTALQASGAPLTMKSMGIIMKDVTARLNGYRADGKIVSEKVKAALS